jgi:hypothetical protein
MRAWIAANPEGADGDPLAFDLAVAVAVVVVAMMLAEMKKMRRDD